MNSILGLIAGMGELPIAVADGARQMGYRVFAIGLEPLVSETLKEHVDEFISINVGKLGKILKTLKESGAKEAVMSGKVPKTLMFGSGVRPDMKAISLLFKLKDRKDDSILRAVTDEFEKEGITLRDITDFTHSLMTPPGVLIGKKPSSEEQKDIEFGFRLAKEIGRLDIGQTVVVKDLAIMAIEAIEGTDMAIKRGGQLACRGAVVIKVSKPAQDKRFDYPAVGLATIRTMKEVKARILALEADNTIMVQKQEMIKEAAAANITIVGVNI